MVDGLVMISVVLFYLKYVLKRVHFLFFGECEVFDLFLYVFVLSWSEEPLVGVISISQLIYLAHGCL